MRVHPALVALLFIALWSSCSPTGIYCRKCGAKLADTAQLTDKGPYQTIDRIQTHGHQLYKVDHGGSDVEMLFGKHVSKTTTEGVPAPAKFLEPGYKFSKLICNECNARLGFQYARYLESPKPFATSKPPSARSSSSATSAPTKMSAAPAAPSTHASPTSTPLAAMPVDSLSPLSKYEGLCLLLPQGWWNYEWCHERHVRQFHRTEEGKMDPSWSLGQFDKSLTKSREARSPQWKRLKNMQTSAGFVGSHFFSGGQMCDETQHGRHSEVLFFCCPGIEHAILQAVTEVAMCSYRFAVCIPELCVAPHPTAGQAVAQPHDATQAVSSSTAPPTRSATRSTTRSTTRSASSTSTISPDYSSRSPSISPRVSASSTPSRSRSSTSSRHGNAGSVPKSGSGPRRLAGSTVVGLQWDRVVLEDSDALTWAEDMDDAVTQVSMRS